MSSDLRAATAQAQNKALEDLAKAYEEAISLWTQAALGCNGRAQERAQRALSDNERQRAAVAERLAAGSQCELSHRDAASLQELAAKAFGERRFADAASLYSKAETMWDLAAEHCTGSQQQIAQRRREQTEIDAHNAEYCAPIFEKAREFTQKFRTAAPGLPVTERQAQSLIAETAWRRATTLCKDAALDNANAFIQTLARERGTPWTAVALPDSFQSVLPKPPAPRPSAVAAATTAAASSEASTGGLGAVISGALGAVKNAVSSPSPEAAPGRNAPEAAKPAPQEMDIRAGDTRYKGQFVREEGQVVSGNGRVEWSNGDVYIGSLVRSVRQGKGEFIWANGQRYVGDWVADKATGQGKLSFANGNQYEGSVVDGSPEGVGQLSFASGDVYKGQISQGLPHGKGLYRWANGQQYEGDYVRAEPQGRGVLRYANGNRYEGSIQAGQPHGQGRMELASGDRYEGEFHLGKPQGQGSYFWKSGERYVGAWVGGVKHGQGVFHWPTGDRWEGLFQADERTEEGTLHRKE